MGLPSEPRADPLQRVLTFVENWKRKLLDLTRRNRALNLRVNKVTTLTIVDELPSEVFRQLVLLERSLRFKAAPEVEPEETGSEREVQADFVPYDPGSLEERHADEWLQTTSTPEALDKSLRRLDEHARSSLEEQGVNTLFLALGMLHYKESTDSEQVFRAPLVLVPVGLSRKSARAGFFLRAIDEEPIVNPALVESLRRQHGVVLPELPDAKEMSETYDLQEFLIGVRDAVANLTGWSVKNDVYLAPFSFQKLVMYKDLEANARALGDHRLIRRLVARDGDSIVGVPDEIRTMDLDEHFPPERTFQVVDADSSQLRAIAAVARDHDLVIEGPPGTGKSQTITNLIGQALSAGKSVLFVAEKMAALSVVHDRLRRTGLSEFCLALHSTKANKRAVMQELAATLDASLEPVAATTISTQRLPAVREALTEYANAVHAPYGTLGFTPYQAFGEFASVLDAPSVDDGGRLELEVTRERFDQGVRDLQDLAAVAKEIGRPDRHPWRDATRTFYSEDDLVSVRTIAADVASRIDRLVEASPGACEPLGLPPIASFADVDVAVLVAEVLARSPGPSLAVLQSDSWDRPPLEADSLVQSGRELARSRERLEKLFAPDVFEVEHGVDIEHARRRLHGLFSFLAFLDGRYRAIKRRWVAWRLPGHSPSMLQQADDLEQVDRCRARERELRDAESRARELFGDRWNAHRSDWNALDAYVRWIVEFRGLCRRHLLTDAAFETASRRSPDLSGVARLQAEAAEAKGRLARLGEIVGWPEGHLAKEPSEQIAARARALASEWRRGPQWAAFVVARRAAESSPGAAVVPPALRGEIEFDDLVRSFRRTFFSRWLSAVVQSRPALQKFQALTHEERVAEFRALDERVLIENRAALVGRLRERVQATLRKPEVTAQLPHLRREMAKQRRLSPLRRTMQQASDAVRAIKPCWMMSPLTVAQLLKGDAQAFDLIIFDEASQLPPEDAVGAILRARQLVVVGDPKQLPPTTFFAVSFASDSADLDEDGQPEFEDSESILEEYMGCGIPMSRLKWHYRSTHESLISFSNKQFYDADLHTFPSVEIGNESSGLQFDYLPDGRYEGQGLNAIEARHVADEVMQFAKEQLERAARGEKRQSLGVGTFNLRQQLAVQDELEQRRRADPSVESFFDRDVVEPFFVKNLENIQGDERDVVFISVTYGRGPDGRIRQNFGPVNGPNGWRRLNVLTTRARQRMTVFSSMRGDEIGAASSAGRGPQLLREFLLFAERGVLESASASLAAEAESPFEREVLAELIRLGIKVVPQVGVAGYRIDLGVVDDEVPGRFVCGIECDGTAYHSAETARDRDRLRQQVLEARGWTMLRVWSTHWFKDRSGQIERLVRLVGEARARARDARELERREKERVATEAAHLAGEKAEEKRREVAALVASQPVEPEYERPTAAPYVLTSVDAREGRADLLSTPLGDVVRAVVRVVETETPIHETDLLGRVAAMWGSRAGSRLQARILEAVRHAEQAALARRRGPFLWSVSTPCRVRSRAGTRIPAERIAPEEYAEAVVAVLAKGHGFARAQLVTEVRTLLGYGRTGASLDEAINAAVDSLLASGRLGEGGTGIRLRS